jgi:uncharacterized protein (TIGR00159 family)
VILSFISIKFLDIIDILLVAFLLYQLYNLIKGTTALKIFIGIALIYLVWLFVKAMRMELISSILGQVIGVGMIALIVVFQQEIRQFLLILGNKYVKRGSFKFIRYSRLQSGYSTNSIEYLAQAAMEMSLTKTGALIVISREASLKSFTEQGEILNADINIQLLKSIFYKDSPLHDGAVLIDNNKIYAAKCILPVSTNTELPTDFGLRHRSALGMSEISDTLTVVVSEQTGKISVAREGKIYRLTSNERLSKIISSFLRRTDD